MKLDVGCGGRGTRWPGFMGIDIWPVPAGHENKYLLLDFINSELPWQENTIDEIICLHMIEHLDRKDGIELLKRMYRILKPGYRMTVTCPDLFIFVRAYLNKDTAFLSKKHINGGKEIWPGRTLADRLNWAIHEETHQWSYDIETLFDACLQAGIKSMEVRNMPKDDKYSTRPDHEIGIIITKGN